MDYFTAILLGAIQGVAEFLPISSSGHLVIGEALLGGEYENVRINVALHFGTLLSILVVYRNRLFPILKSPRLCVAIVVATLPVVVVGLLLKDQIDRFFDTPVVAGCALCVTALLMALTRRVEHGERRLEKISWRDALVVGLFQAIAPVPGISRSGSTIFGGLVSGLRRDAAADFSFFIAIPALTGAMVLHLGDLLHAGESDLGWGPLLTGTVTAFGVGVVALHGLLKLVVGRKLHWFAWYCGAVGIATIIWQLLA
ncbi:MAG: undecaprenyl-diphosphate phosphatase [Planctomycetota bacterium]|nr:MAG: undecaprenyl-diphosphate phosphatase [Planctomycetota bacterium]REJ89870.1 MAG: undecaprenyl-diphosphate phosphatase [Planctomycetota bacterium]REK20932.1 MAG: undecaprenyl-diphosphate phosphatase [Planctomycetota bacterium]REK37287.1 MAG: undecaprenyl-diphosphate phosphatase [Planctomycetota bacterium]